MPRPLSLDIRERVIARVESGDSRRGAAEQFDISASAAIKLLQRWSATGNAALLTQKQLRSGTTDLDAEDRQVVPVGHIRISFSKWLFRIQQTQ